MELVSQTNAATEAEQRPLGDQQMLFLQYRRTAGSLVGLDVRIATPSTFGKWGKEQAERGRSPWGWE